MSALASGLLLAEGRDTRNVEQVVGGASIVNVGKRADALMRTSGIVRWLTFGVQDAQDRPVGSGVSTWHMAAVTPRSWRCFPGSGDRSMPWTFHEDGNE